MEKYNYIANNPARKGLSDRIDNYPWSSFYKDKTFEIDKIVFWMADKNVRPTRQIVVPRTRKASLAGYYPTQRGRAGLRARHPKESTHKYLLNLITGPRY